MCYDGSYIVLHYYLTSVCLQTATKKRPSPTTQPPTNMSQVLLLLQTRHMSSYLITEARATHMPALMGPQLPCPHISPRCLLPLGDAAVQRPQWHVSMPLIFFTCPTITLPTLPHLIPYRNQPIEQLVPLLQRRHSILLTTLINNDNPIFNLPVRRPSDNNPSLPT